MYFIEQSSRGTIDCVYDDETDWFELLFNRLAKYNTIQRVDANEPGLYLQQDGTHAALIKKSYVTRVGYLYNTTQLQSETISTFRKISKGHLDISNFVRPFEEPFSCKAIMLVDSQIDIGLLIDKLCDSEYVTVVTEQRSKYSKYHKPESCSLSDLEKRLLGKGCVVLDVDLSEDELERILDMPRAIPLIICYDSMPLYERYLQRFDYILPNKSAHGSLALYLCEMSRDLDSIIDDTNKNGQLVIVNKPKPMFHLWTMA